jgi:hypothetical protein
MIRKPPTEEESTTLSPVSLRKLAADAERLCGPVTDDDGHLNELIAKLAASSDRLTEGQQSQLKQLGELMMVANRDPNAVNPLRRDGVFQLEPSADGMFLILTIVPPAAGGSPVELGQIVQWLKDHDIRRGVNMRRIQQAVALTKEGKAVADMAVVSGRPPEPGQDARFELYARRSLNQPLEQVDAANPPEDQNSAWLCRAGDRVAQLIPAKAGTNGYTAMGQPTQASKPRSVELIAGRNVRLEGNNYFAQVGGVVVFDPQRGHLEVRPVLVLNQDVSKAQGVVEFDGEVLVHGGVRSGAVLRATANIMVDGPVEAAEIESTNGEVYLRHGVAGRHRAVIRALTNVRSRFVENATIYAGQDIVVDVGALHSRLVAGRSIRICSGRGQLIGGYAMAGELIEVCQLGARSDTATEVMVGLSSEMMAKVARIDDQIDQLRLRRDDCAEVADQMQRMIGDPARLAEAELKIYLKLRQNQLANEYEMMQLGEQRAQLVNQSVAEHPGRVDVLREMMPKVMVRIGNRILNNDRLQRHCRVAYDEKTDRIAVRAIR